MSAAQTATTEVYFDMDGKKQKNSKKDEQPEAKIEVERSGKKIIVPLDIPLEKAITTLTHQLKYEEEVVNISEAISGCFWDGAYAFSKAMENKFGWVHAKPEMTMFGEKKPQMVSLKVSPKDTVLVPWGIFNVPGVDGILRTGYDIENGRFVFVAQADIKRKHEHVFRDLVKITRQLVKDKSIYRGKALRIRFCDDDGEKQPMFMPNFMEIGGLDPESLILSKELMAAVSTSVFAPIIHADACRVHRVPLKRGVLMSGVYGTGKTLTAYMTAALCEKAGWTFIYCEKASDLSEAVRFAHSYQPAAIFCEDIDRVLDGERSVSMDDILNIIDGIESKNTEIMTILTTNHVEKINKAMLRPGRLDAIIEFTRPDAETTERLIRHYGKGLIQEGEDLQRAAHELVGQIPAVIRECVERAKLSAIKLGGGEGDLHINGAAIYDAALGMKSQLRIMTAKPQEFGEEKVLYSAFAGLVAESVRELLEGADAGCGSIRGLPAEISHEADTAAAAFASAD